MRCILLYFGLRHRCPLGLDIACNLCTVGWPSRPYFTNSGMKDFTSKFYAEIIIVFLKSIQLTMDFFVIQYDDNFIKLHKFITKHYGLTC
jgi:hypothetical protein